jgi:hypothetical protein
MMMTTWSTSALSDDAALAFAFIFIPSFPVIEWGKTLVIERPQAHIISIGGYIKQSEAFCKNQKATPGGRLQRSTMFARTRLLVIRLTLTLHLFVLLHHFLLHLLPFGLLVRC